MKVLLAISSWPPSAINGDHQSSRNTWLQYAHGLDYKFFMGDGNAVHENDDLIDAEWERRPGHYATKPSVSDPITYVPKADEVLLPCPYDFKHLPFKVREICYWTLDCDYDYLFKVDTDTYVDIPRLLASGFEQHDYIGTPFTVGDLAYASGGAGYWVSRRAMCFLATAAIATPWDDIWVGQTLREYGIPLHIDTRYNVCSPHDFSSGPRPDNDSITSHLGFSPEPFNQQDMYAAHKLRWPQ